MGALEKGCLYKIVQIIFRIYDNVAHPSCDVRPAILCKWDAKVATNLHNAPIANAPFSGFLRYHPHRTMTSVKRSGILDFVSVGLRKRKEISGNLLSFVIVACCCGLCVPNMPITRANAKEYLVDVSGYL